ncbi:MAG: glycoside-pentoside-hexuronide (GPH):cation symporter [Propionibacteriaceae bacterium]|jgi:melibiose permease/lactose/raffinose/galactose permease|nr:glycoside-pentoside-hexuronide (GPH):cation symporter [Propionibacteriaceae bacterium]
MSANLNRRNKWTFSVGTLGRDMVYTLVSMYLMVYLTEALDLPDWVLAWAASLILIARLFDAVMDIVMGSIVDNTRSRWGRFKPWIFAGMILSGIFTVLLFTDVGAQGWGFVGIFAGSYLFWGLSWTMNDIPYWSLMPALTVEQKERERIGSLAKIFASIGLFSVAVLVVPITGMLGDKFGAPRAWTIFALCVVTVMIVGQIVTLAGTKIPELVVAQDKVKLREVFSVVVKNDQLLWTAIAMVTFMTGYLTTTTFGVHYFIYVYGDEGMYAPFAGVLGIAQITGYAIFPLLRKRLKRRTLYTLAISLVAAGYIIFFFAPMNIFIIGFAALLLFIGVAFITVLMLVFISDTIDYGHWKLGRRNVAITFALQPFINKVGAALAFEIAAVTLVVTGINEAKGQADVTDEGLLILKIVMMLVPLILTVTGFLIHRWKYRIDETFHAQILQDLRERGQLIDEEAVAQAHDQFLTSDDDRYDLYSKDGEGTS